MKTIHKIILMAAAALLSAAMLVPSQAAAQVHSSGYVHVNDIVYRDTDAYAQQQCRLDVAYVPGQQDRPVIVWFHGGGLTSGRKEVPERLLTDNFVVIGVEYRFAPNVPVADIVDDAALAVAWVFAHAQEYGGSVEKIYLAGHSAGGYLIDLVGLDKKWLAKYDIDADRIAALVPYSGQVVTHYTERAAHGIGPLDPVIDDLAPLAHMRADAPPMFVISGDSEQELYARCEETKYFVHMMRLKGHKDIRFVELQGFNHGDMVLPGHDLMVKYVRERESARNK